MSSELSVPMSPSPQPHPLLAAMQQPQKIPSMPPHPPTDSQRFHTSLMPMDLHKLDMTQPPALYNSMPVPSPYLNALATAASEGNSLPPDRVLKPVAVEFKRSRKAGRKLQS